MSCDMPAYVFVYASPFNPSSKGFQTHFITGQRKYNLIPLIGVTWLSY